MDIEKRIGIPSDQINIYLTSAAYTISEKEKGKDIRVDKVKNNNPEEGNIHFLIMKFKKGKVDDVDYLVRVYFSRLIDKWIVEKYQKYEFDSVKRFKKDFEDLKCFDAIFIEDSKQEENLEQRMQGCVLMNK